MTPAVTPFLMFEGAAEEAMNLYVSLFPESSIERLERYGTDEDGPEGTVKRGAFVIAGQRVLCFDSPTAHDFRFTPAVSLFVQLRDEAEFNAVFERLQPSGTVLMPPGDYGFSERYGWLNDRFGVSWQLNVGEVR